MTAAAQNRPPAECGGSRSRRYHQPCSIAAGRAHPAAAALELLRRRRRLQQCCCLLVYCEQREGFVVLGEACPLRCRLIPLPLLRRHVHQLQAAAHKLAAADPHFCDGSAAACKVGVDESVVACTLLLHTPPDLATAMQLLYSLSRCDVWGSLCSMPVLHLPHSGMPFRAV